MNNSDRTQIEAAIMSSENEEKKRDAKELEAAEEEPKVRLFFFVNRLYVECRGLNFQYHGYS